MKKYAVTLLNALAVFVGLLLLWQGLGVVLHLPPYMLPPPLAAASAAWRISEPQSPYSSVSASISLIALR